MTGSDAGTGADPLILDAENWLQELLPDLSQEDRGLLSELDREIIFDGLVEFAKQEHTEIMEVRTEPRAGEMSADASWLIPRTRIHIRAGASARDAAKRLVRMAVVFVTAGNANPRAGFVGLTIDLVMGIFERTSRLDDVEFDIVRAVIELGKSGEDRLPTEADLRILMPNVNNLAARLNSLKDRGVLAGGAEGWRYIF